MALHRDIHWIGRQWAVTGHGMQLIDQKLKGFFDVEIARLWEDALIETMRAKEWLNVADFDKGLEVARKRFPRDGVTPPGEPTASVPPVAATPVVSTPPVAPAPVVARAPAVASAPTPEARPAAPVPPVAPAPPKAPEAPVIVSVKPVRKARAIAPILDIEEPPVQEPDMVESAKPAPGIFQMRFPGHGKFVRPWRVRMKE